MKKLRFGILSTSSIAPRFIKGVQAAENCEAYALASRSLKKAREKAALWNVPRAYGSYEELLESDEIDVAYVAMINSKHYKYAKMALEHGKHVLCEK
ncbi:MAG: Gfo/Idh/MocA family oxidoreductase, partial [Lachnospiraceae bacterium]|nr:Gfo/Idh/MocA family oxidoreductase [Lachnospiraceae bacterium]